MRNIPGLLATTFCIAYLISAKGKRLSEHEGNVIIIGAGPAGLTAGYELVTRTSLRPIIFEEGDIVGGISRTVSRNGNRTDVGPHRFFSKSSRVISWWFSMLPLQRMDNLVAEQTQNAVRQAMPEFAMDPDAPDPSETDNVMLVRTRLTRILFRKKLFDYPLTPTLTTLRNLGLVNLARFALSYLHARLFPIEPVVSLEDFFINRFGRKLYGVFFRDYTEKVWGVPCSQIQPSWGAQRIKGLSIGKAVLDAMRSVLPGGRSGQGRNGETSLISYFLYPKRGAGQMWETVAAKIVAGGGEIRLNQRVVGIDVEGTRICGVRVQDAAGNVSSMKASHVFSTMPVRDLVSGMGTSVPDQVREAAAGLRYREFMSVVVTFRKLKGKEGRLPDNWLYIQEPGVRVGRIVIYNNWSPALVRDPSSVLLGLEYFCDETDTLWNMGEPDLLKLAIRELEILQFADGGDFVEGFVARAPKAYPGYFGGYGRFPVVREFLARFDNLYPIGRNGMHRYNNMDHSMLTAMTAVDNIVNGVAGKENIWDVNAEEEYHETGKRAENMLPQR